MPRSKMVDPIVKLLIQTAKERGTIPYSTIYGMFKKAKCGDDVWSTFEEACREICRNDIAVYSSLMANKYDVPEVGFFDIYRTMKPSDYNLFASGTDPRDLTHKQKVAIADFEREIVYNHAAYL